jgi:tungstate transport system permease protein
MMRILRVAIIRSLNVNWSADLWPIVGLSLRVSATAVLLSTLVGVPLGAWLGLTRWRWRGPLSVLIYTGMGLPPVVVGLVLYLLLSRSGPLGWLGWLFTPKAMVLAQIILIVPYIVGITMSAVAAVPAEVFAQVRSLGASKWQARRALLREARPGVFLAVAAAFGRSISEVGAVFMVGGNIKDHTRVMTTTIMMETNKGDFALALALGGCLLALALAVNVLILRVQGRPVS